MLTQGPKPDPKCKLNISSFLTLPHPSDCLICANDIMINVLLLQMMGDGEVGGGSFMLKFGWGERGWVSYFLFSFFCSVFVFLLIALSWLLRDSF